MGAPLDPLAALDAAQEAFSGTGPVHQVGGKSALQPWTEQLVIYLSGGVLVFTVIALLLSTLLLWRSKARAEQILRNFGILTIIGMSSMLLVAGYSNEQLTPIVGLFGAIAGYLLGKDTKATPRVKPVEDAKP